MKTITKLNVTKLFVLSAILLLALPIAVHAETHIPTSQLTQNTLWDKSGSPYIIDGTVTVPQGITLTVGPGTEVIGDPTYLTRAFIKFPGGKLIVNGRGADVNRVRFNNLMGIEFYGGSLDVRNADFDGVNHTTIYDARGYIATTTFLNSHDGLKIKNSAVRVEGSKFKDLRRAITLEWNSPPVLMMNDSAANGETGGIGNALDELNNEPTPSLTVINSSLAGNYTYALNNYENNVTVKAENNWWGRPEGPLTQADNAYGDVVLGGVDYEPWLMAEPALDPGPDAPACCSSILFLPGLEASYIYRPESSLLGLDQTNTLWPPNSNEDARKLFLNKSGASKDASIYSGAPLDKVFGLYGIYGKFMGFLDDMVRDGTMNEWRSFGYDWRKPIAEVVAGPECKATTTEYLINTVEDLAAHSKTGKVTLIAHSNGGLVAKYLVKTLVDLGKDSLIDSVISVAVPYLGTPQAIAGLLHGDDQSLGFGVVLKQSVARQLGQNMASAYSLLPSADYFSNIIGPTIAFASSTVPGLNDGSYPTNIQSAAAQDAFIVDANNVRRVPEASDYDRPIKGNQLLMTAAEVLHSIIDPFSWPASIAHWAIVGWNRQTTDGITYSGDSYKTDKTYLGDGTVVAGSAQYQAADVASLDLQAASRLEKGDFSHANILESNTTQSMVGDIVTKQERDLICAEVNKTPGAACGAPAYENEPTSLRVSTHSPVELHIYDEEGNHTGIIQSPPEVEDDVLTFFDHQIAGASLDITRDGNDMETSISLPDDGRKYSVVVKGIGVGAFTLDVDRIKGGSELLEHAGYADIPATPFSLASTTLQVPAFDPSAASTANSIYSYAQPLAVDIDGDGAVDIQATSSTSDDIGKPHEPIRYLEALKRVVITVLGSTNPSKNLIKRIDRLEKLVTDGKEKRVIKISNKFEKRVARIKPKKLSDAEKQQIIEMVEAFLVEYGIK